MKPSIGEDKDKIKGRIEGVIRKDAPAQLRKVIKEEFVKELKLK